MKQRFAPFLVLLEARYAPLLFAVAPQAYAIYLWLFPRPYDGTGEFFAVIGALGYEFIYVGAIAWAEDGKAGRWTWATAAVALVFSIAVAIFVYQAQGLWSVLHAGFPLVAFGYTMQLHGMAKREQSSAIASTAQTVLELAPERLGATEEQGGAVLATAIPASASVVAPLEVLSTPLSNGKHPPAAQASWLDELLASGFAPSAPLETVVIDQAYTYQCEHCGSELASKQAKGNAARFGCANLACPGRANRKAA